MQKKTKKIEDKAIWNEGDEEGSAEEMPPSPTPVENGEPTADPLTVVKGRVTIRMKARRGWQLPDRELQPGECVTLDEETARPIIEAGYADVVE